VEHDAVCPRLLAERGRVDGVRKGLATRIPQGSDVIDVNE